MGEGNWYQKSAADKDLPIIRHELLAEKPPSGNSFVMDKSITNFIGSSISLPDQWKSSTSDQGTMRATTFKAPGDSATLTLFDRGAPLSEQSAKTFNKLLADNANLTRAKELMPTEIKSLSNVLGSTTAGDNQYTNSAKPPAPRSPAFHIFSAHLTPLNGKTVLEVQGNFVTETGGKGKEFIGLFVPAGKDGTRVQEFFLQADNAADAARHQKDYKQSVQSIKW